MWRVRVASSIKIAKFEVAADVKIIVINRLEAEVYSDVEKVSFKVKLADWFNTKVWLTAAALLTFIGKKYHFLETSTLSKTNFLEFTVANQRNRVLEPKL